MEAVVTIVVAAKISIAAIFFICKWQKTAEKCFSIAYCRSAGVIVKGKKTKVLSVANLKRVDAFFK